MDFDLLMQSSPVVSAKAAISKPQLSTEASPGLLVPISIPQVSMASNESSAKSAGPDSDVCMLDSASSPENNGACVSDDVQILHSPPPGSRSSNPAAVIATAPTFVDITLKIENIKPSMTFTNCFVCFFLFVTCHSNYYLLFYV